MTLRISAFLAVSCLGLAIAARPATAGPQGSEPVGLGDVPADTHLQAPQSTDPTPAPTPEPAAQPESAKKKARHAHHHEGKAAESSSDDADAASQAGSSSDKAGTDSGPALITDLRETGYTLVVRHAHAATSAPDKAAADSDNTNLEPELDAQGREQAKMLGVTLRALDVPIGELLSSSAYRAQETVKLARFGDPVVDSNLDEGAQGMAVPASTGSSSGGSWLRSAAAKSPRRGTNRLIVTHLPVIVAAFGKNYANVAPDEVLVVKPDGEGDATVVGRLTIDELKKLSGK